MRLRSLVLVATACQGHPPNWEVDARIREALKRSLEPYPRAETKDDAVRYVRDVLSFPERAVLVYDGRVVVDRRFLRQEKNQKHANFLASIVAKRKSVKNAAYAYSGNSTGFCGRHMGAMLPLASTRARGLYTARLAGSALLIQYPSVVIGVASCLMVMMRRPLSVCFL